MKSPADKHNQVYLYGGALFALCMLLFVFVGLVPLYNLICDITGLTGRVNQASVVSEVRSQKLESQSLNVSFVTRNNDGNAWGFSAKESSLKIETGKLYKTEFKVHNSTDKAGYVQAVSSVSPFDATPYFKKIECFCFEKQFLNAGESIEFPLVFMVQNELEDDIYDLTLSYTLYTLDP